MNKGTCRRPLAALLFVVIREAPSEPTRTERDPKIRSLLSTVSEVTTVPLPTL